MKCTIDRNSMSPAIGETRRKLIWNLGENKRRMNVRKWVNWLLINSGSCEAHKSSLAESAINCYLCPRNCKFVWVLFKHLIREYAFFLCFHISPSNYKLCEMTRNAVRKVSCCLPTMFSYLSSKFTANPPTYISCIRADVPISQTKNSRLYIPDRSFLPRMRYQ